MHIRLLVHAPRCHQERATARPRPTVQLCAATQDTDHRERDTVLLTALMLGQPRPGHRCGHRSARKRPQVRPTPSALVAPGQNDSTPAHSQPPTARPAAQQPGQRTSPCSRTAHEGAHGPTMLCHPTTTTTGAIRIGDPIAVSWSLPSAPQPPPRPPTRPQPVHPWPLQAALDVYTFASIAVARKVPAETSSWAAAVKAPFVDS